MDITIAILPIKYLSKNESIEFLVAGLSDDLVISLSKFSGLAVVSPVSTAHIKDINDNDTITQLGIEYLVSGSFRSLADQARISIQLTRASDSKIIFTSEYMEDVDQLLSIQIDIVKQIVNAIQQQIGFDLLAISHQKEAVQLAEVISELTVREIGPETRKIYGQLIFDSFDWADPRLVDWLSTTVSKSGYRHYLALQNEQPVAAAALHIAEVYATMAFAGTAAEYRGLGAHSLLLRTRIEEARKAGCRYLISETAAPKAQQPGQSYQNMRRFGFEEAYRRENWLYEF